MKKMIRLVGIILSVCLLLTGCVVITEEDKHVSTKSDEIASEDKVTSDETHTDNEAVAPEVTVEETVVYDGSDIKITLKDIETGWLGLDIKLLVENYTNKNIVLSGENVVVNGVTMSCYMYIEVAAGKKTNGTITIYNDNLDLAQIKGIAWVQTCDAHIVDTDSFATIADVSFEIQTSLGRDYVQVIDESGELLYEANGIQVFTKVMSDEFYGKNLVLYVKNGSGKDVIIRAENISVNGFTMDAWMYDFVSAGTVRFCELDLWESGLEENGIDVVENISFTVQITDANSYYTLAESGELQVFIQE